MVEHNFDAFYEYFRECLVSSHTTSLPAEAGRRDNHLHELAQELKEQKNDFEIIDYGCGRGRFAEALNNLSLETLKRMTYIGVDLDEEALIENARNAINNNFVSRVRGFYLLNGHYFLNDVASARYIYMIHVIHEMFSIYVPYVLKALMLRLEPGGKLIITELQDMSSFPEMDFEIWTIEEFKMMFKKLHNVEFAVETFDQLSKNKKLHIITVIITKKGQDVLVPDEINEEQYLQVLNRKRIRTFASIREYEEKSGNDPRYYAYLKNSHSNICRRIMEVEIESAVRNLSQDITCLACFSGKLKISLRTGRDEFGGTDPTYYECHAKCSNCEYEIKKELGDLGQSLTAQKRRVSRAYLRTMREAEISMEPQYGLFRDLEDEDKDDFKKNITSIILEKAMALVSSTKK